MNLGMDLTMFLFLLATLPGSIAATGMDRHFMGGSMMFKFIDTYKAPYKLKITTLTGWVRGMGPCGKTCSIADIGKNTTETRHDMLTLYGDTYFGNWTQELGFYNQSNKKYKLVTSYIINNIESHVVGVSFPMKWEQELADVIVDIDPTTEYTDISLHGPYWRWFEYVDRYSNYPVQSRLQIKVKAAPRDDTKKPNNSPVIMYKPVYRILLNKASTINLSPMDPDGDIVECSYAEYVEAGGLGKLNNTVVNKNCSVVIDAQESAGFRDGGWGAIPVRVVDYAANCNNSINSFISAINVQFMIQTVKTITSPEFVNPTEESGHEYIVYVGSTLKIPLFAKPISGSDINKFYLSSIPYKTFTVDPPKADSTRIGERVKYTNVSWRPGKSDVGEHIISALVTDSQGSDGVDRNYNVIVKDIALLPQNDIPHSGPCFPLFPDKNRLVCLLASTCSFPIYTNTQTPGGVISDVKTILSTFQATFIDPPTPTTKDGIAMFVSEVTVNPSEEGDHKICFEASENIRNNSASKCLTVEVKIPNPCRTHPCVHGMCRSENHSYICSCDRKHSGRNCENEIDFCAKNPCLNNARCSLSDHNNLFDCDCTGTGYLGSTCNIDETDCTFGACEPYGVCSDLKGKFECHCYDGYYGDDCKSMNDTCRDTTCKNGGFCLVEAGVRVCKCPLGFSGPDCNDIDRSIQVNTGTKDNPFIVPSLPNGAEIVCFVHERCMIPVYTKTNGTLDVHVGIHTGNMTASIVYTKKDPSIGRNTVKSLLDIRSHTAGLFTVCVTSGGIYPDSLCYKVDAKARKYSRFNKVIPRFVPPTQQDHSIINCIQGKPCHTIISTEYNPFLRNCTLYSGSISAIVFNTIQSGDVCETDVLFNPPTIGDKEVCLQAGPMGRYRGRRYQGERRCYTLKTILTDSCNPNPCHNAGECILQPGEAPTYQCICPVASTGDICQYHTECTNTSCQNGGFCGLHGNAYKCKCPVGSGGHECAKITIPTYNLFTEPTLNNGATVVCEVGETCDIPVFLPEESILLDVGPKAKDVDVDIWKHVGKAAAKSNEDILRVTPLEVGIMNICIEAMSITATTKQTICYHIRSNQGHISVGADDFKSPTLPAGSTIPCSANKQCHVMMYSRPDGHKCQQVEDLGSAGLDLHIFPSTLVGGSCVTDVLFSSDVPTGSRRFCLGLGTSSLRCYKVDPNTADPCKNRNCGYGACIVEGNSYSCVCDDKHQGTACELDINVPIVG